MGKKESSVKLIRETKFFLLLFVCFLCIANVNSSPAQKTGKPDKFNLIPYPASLVSEKGHFTLTSSTVILVNMSDSEILRTSEYAANEILKYCTIKVIVKDINEIKSNKNCIILENRNNTEDIDSYSLEINKNKVVISGNNSSGVFYGVQTFLQLIYPNDKKSDKIKIPALKIQDKAIYKWRGMHLDVSRHFFSVEFIKKLMDVMALHKLNTFHWHLTDDQGWRIEIKKYPKLTEIGAWRNSTLIGHASVEPARFDSIRYGGFYTQEQVKDVVEYAKRRHITIVPEIEMPGHAVAALSAYPELSCTGGPFEVWNNWGINENVFCAGKENTFVMLENILTEVAELFPGDYIHIGGDECPKDKWKNCENCQKRIRDEKLKNENALQGYFVRRIEEFLATKGKKIIGWDEILEDSVPTSAAIMSWRGYEGGIKAASEEHYVVMTPVDNCYLDYYQAKDNEPLAIGGFLPLEKVYSFNPMPVELSVDKQKYILGAQANLWTEYLDSESKVEYMLFPRLCAMAEVLWTSPEKKNYNDFLIRLKTHLKRLDKENINYRKIE